MHEEMQTNEPMVRLEQKIDALARNVETLSTSMNAGFQRVDERFVGVNQRLTDVDQRLSEMDQRLRKVHVFAEETKSFSHNVYDSLATLTKNVDEGFKEAKKDSDEKFDVVHKAILHWGDKVKVLETARTRRATKRRR